MTVTRTLVGRRRSGLAGAIAMAAMLGSACGSTAYRDAVEVGAAGTLSPSPEQVVVPEDAHVDPETGDLVDDETGEVIEEDFAAPSAAGPGAGSSGTSGASTAPNDGQAGSRTGGSGSAGGPGSGPDQGSDSGSGGGTPESGSDGEAAPASSDPIRVGFIWIKSTREFQEALGFSSSSLGPLDQIAQALAAWVNERGGLGGRPIEPVMQDYFMEEASPDREAQICNSLADDRGVEAVVFQGMIHGSTRYCYAGKGVVMLDPAPFVFDDDLYAETSPFYWSPSYPNYSRIVRGLVPNLASRGFFEPMESRTELETKVGVVLWDAPAEKRILETDMIPALEAAGIPLALTHAVDPSNAGTIQNGLANGVVRFRNEGINRVMFIGGSPLAPFWYLNADQGGYRPRYGVTTLDAPRHTENSQTNPRQMDDAIGIGMAPINDVHDPQYPFPGHNDTERLCLDITKDVWSYETRADAQAMLAYCESLLLLKAGADLAGAPFEAVAWAAAAERLGSGYVAATPWASSFGPGKHDGGDAFRDITHNRVCPTTGTTGSCFTYSGPVRSFG